MNKQLFIIAGSLILLSASIFWAVTRNNTKETMTITNTQNQPSVVHELTAESAPLAIANVPGILIVDFYAEWCGPCKTLKPIFEEIAKEFKDKYSFGRINIDQCQQVAQQYQVTSIPTIIIFSGGKVLDTLTGMMPKETLLERIEQALNGPQDLSMLSQEALDNKLMQAIQGALKLEDIKRIIEAGANVNYVPSNGMTPLLMAIVINGSRGMDATELLEFLITRGASTEFVDAQTGTKTQALDFVQMMSQNCKRMADNYDKIALIFEAHKTKSKECSQSSCSL